jgi:hypothetical protein
MKSGWSLDLLQLQLAWLAVGFPCTNSASSALTNIDLITSTGDGLSQTAALSPIFLPGGFNYTVEVNPNAVEVFGKSRY